VARRPWRAARPGAGVAADSPTERWFVPRKS